MKEKTKSKAFGSVFVSPDTATVLQIMPPRSPFFEPKRAQITCLHAEDPTRAMDLKIGSVTIGGSPQLAINALTPSRDSQGIRPEDLHCQNVNWSVFSTVGLARELQMSVYNPNREPVAAFVSLDGFDVHSLDEYDGFARFNKVEEGDGDIVDRKISGNDIELEPFEHGVIRLIPTVSPFFEPKKIRFHGRGCDSGQRVPFTVVNAYCGDRLLYDARSMVDMIDLLLSDSNGLQNFSKTMKALGGSKWLESLVSGLCSDAGLSEWGASMDRELKKIRSQKKKNISGMLSSHISDGQDGWGCISWWPRISTLGMAQEAGILVYNPWPFRIRANATVAGNPSHGHNHEGAEIRSRNMVRLHNNSNAINVIPETVLVQGSDGPEKIRLPRRAPAATDEMISFIGKEFENISMASSEELVIGREVNGGYRRIATLKCYEFYRSGASAEDVANFCMRIMAHDSKDEAPGNYRIMIDSYGKGLAKCIHVEFSSLALGRQS